MSEPDGVRLRPEGEAAALSLLATAQDLGIETEGLYSPEREQDLKRVLEMCDEPAAPLRSDLLAARMLLLIHEETVRLRLSDRGGA